MTPQQRAVAAELVITHAHRTRKAEAALVAGEARSPGIVAMKELRAAASAAAIALDDALDACPARVETQDGGAQ